MARHFKKKAILAKIEATYGVDATPTGAANAILVRNAEIDPMENDYVTRELVRAFLAGNEELPAVTRVMLSFEVEMAGAGAAGTAPGYGPLLRACGLSETVTATVKVEYKPVSSGFESVTIYFNMDGKQHKLLGCRGNVAFKLNAKGIPVFAFKFTGLYGGAPTDTALPAQTLTAFQKPVPVNRTNTSGFSLHGYAGYLYGLELDLNNKIVHRDLVGTEDVLIVDRKPSGSVSIEDPTQAQKDYFTAIKSGTLGALAITHGTAAGNKVLLDAPQLQLTNPKFEDQEGIAGLKMDALLLPTSAGNDEILITVQ